MSERANISRICGPGPDGFTLCVLLSPLKTGAMFQMVMGPSAAY